MGSAMTTGCCRAGRRRAARRGWLPAGAFTLAAFAGAALAAAGAREEAPPPLRELDFGPFEAAMESLSEQRVAVLDELVIEATFAGLQAAMAAGELTAVELTSYYLSRIRKFDVDGLRSMLELNPDALAIAAQRDAGAVRGPLHGIPVSLKGNIGTGDAMHTTAGAAALAQARADRDAHVAAALRAAGAVIIGKANLSEWSNWMHDGPSGYSALGGQVVSPYDPALDPLGSSTGSAVGVSANLVAASIGTETVGSLIAPASVNGVVSIYPSRGRVSRDRIIPLTDQTDAPGPVARTVRDAAILLTAIAGHDPNDPASVQESVPTDYAAGLALDALAGKRIGFLMIDEPDAEVTPAVFLDESGLGPVRAALAAAGAEVVLIWDSGQEMSEDEATLQLLLDNGLRIGFAEYAAATGLTGAITSIADVVAFNERDPEAFAFYGQPLLESAAASTLPRAEYEAAGARLRERARAHVDGLFAAYELDAIVSIADLFSGSYALAGYPAITVPAGLAARGMAYAHLTGGEGSPFGLTFTGRLFEDAQIIGYAYAFEQASLLRVAVAGRREDRHVEHEVHLTGEQRLRIRLDAVSIDASPGGGARARFELFAPRARGRAGARHHAGSAGVARRGRGRDARTRLRAGDRRSSRAPAHGPAGDERSPAAPGCIVTPRDRRGLGLPYYRLPR